MTESKVMHLAEKGGAWTGTIGGEDVTFVIHGEVTGIELFDRCLDDDEIRKAFKDKPKTKTIYKWAFRHSGKWWKETECFYATKEDAANSAAGLDALGRNEIVRMDATAIEVDA